jgi:PTH1 family peptidyl-tRNA hydrolase
MYAVIGLGNPKKKYQSTRHNAGFMLVDWLAGEFSAPRFSTHNNTVTTDVTISGQTVKLAKSLEMMNNSGVAVKNLIDYFDIPAENVIVVHDDIDVRFGATKLVFDRGSGGHNGVNSVIDQLGTNTFYRLRLGIAPKESGEVEKTKYGKAGISPYVLGRFTPDEKQMLKSTFPHAKVATEQLVSEGVEAAQNSLH